MKPVRAVSGNLGGFASGIGRQRALAGLASLAGPRPWDQGEPEDAGRLGGPAASAVPVASPGQ